MDTEIMDIIIRNEEEVGFVGDTIKDGQATKPTA